nr:efflux transporter outer membrane subunit [Salinimicrobium sediminis]
MATTVIIIGLLFSCSPRLSPADAPIPQPEAFSFSGTAALSDKWWENFEDPVLDSLIEQGLEQNLELAGNWEQFQAALAVVDRESSFFWPQVDATAGTAVTRPRDEFSRNEDLQVGLSASYELDLWGRIRAAVQAEEFRAQATLFDYQAAAMSISAEISITWYRLLSARKQLELADEQIRTNEDIMRLIRARFTGGQIRAVDILRQEQLLEGTRDERIFYETRIAVLKNQLAVLLGRPPQNVDVLTTAALPELPPLPASGLPLELVRRRPDLRQSYNLVLAADREMAQAIRSKYPRISLNAVGQAQGGNFNDLFQDWAYTLAGNLVAPLFYGGRLNAEVNRTEALKNSTLYQYGQDVLIAFEEVENALIREQKQNERIQLLERRLDLSAKTNRQLRNEFLNGMTEYLEVLLSLDQEQQLQREMIQAQQERLEYRIALYRALAGGFETEPMENINTGS